MARFDYMTVATEGYAIPEFDFADRIRKVRRDVAHMTQEEMAGELGVSQKAYSAWESGRSRPGDIVGVAKRIAMRWRGITAEWILGLDSGPRFPTGGGANAPLPLVDESPLRATIPGPLAYLVASRPATSVKQYRLPAALPAAG